MNASTPLCAPTADAAFGPAVAAGCRGGFDFTLLFEQAVFVLLPASLLLVAAPLRLVRLAKAPVYVGAPKLRASKLRLGPLQAVGGGLAALQLALVGLWAAGSSSAAAPCVRAVSVAAACVSMASSLMSCALSYFEHARSPRPSSLLNVFLLVSVLLDAALLRTLWLSAPASASVPVSSRVVPPAVQPVFTVSLAVKAALLETAGIYARAVFAWVAPLLRTGFRRLLRPDDLFVLDAQMTAALLSERFWSIWKIRGPKIGAESHKYRLVACCLLTLRWPLVVVIVPRLVQLGFTICQPLVLHRFLVFLDDKTQPDRVGYGLVGAYGLVYIGIAVSQALYWHRNGRFVTMLRGVLVSAVFSKATEVSVTATDDAAAVTLMSSDVEVIVRAFKEINEFWANLIQIAIATWLLSDRIGYASAGPIIVSLVALLATILVSPLAKKYRVGWLEKTQKRVGITSAMIGHIKSIKMSGLAQQLSSTIAALRLDEIKASRPFRVFGSVTSAVAQVPLLISPPVAFAMFQGVAAQSGEKLDATRLFSTLSFIILLAQPLFWMFEVVLDLSAAFGAFERIQRFLVEQTRTEYRDMDNIRPVPELLSEEGDGQVEMRPLARGAASIGHATEGDKIAISIRDACFSWTSDKMVLNNIDFSLARGQFGMIVGPVASGKSTLLKGLLGEVPVATGHIAMSGGKLSWCDQSPWILNQSIRDNIIGYSLVDEELYQKVIKACELERDLTQLPNGDMTVVGSKGLALSGGQKQRVALARAVYSRPEIALFDDVFSGLDNHTASRVLKNLFSPAGLFKKWGTTVLLATQSVNFLETADVILSLSREGRVAERGTLNTLKTAGGYIASVLSTTSGHAAVSKAVESAEDLDSYGPKADYRAKVQPEQQDKRRQLGDSTVYRYYFGSIAVWLNFWVEAMAEGRTGYYLGIYAALQIIGVVWFAALIWFVLVLVAAKSGVSLHHRLLHTVVRAPLSLFTSTDLGSITTRFSQDIGMVDNNLPLALVVTIASFFSVLAKAGLLAASSYYVAISFPFLGLLYFYLQRGYLRTSRQLRFLDLEQKAPLYTQFLETLAGLPTLRAFGWSRAAVLRNHALVDASQQPFYLLIMVQRWLVLVLDLVTAALALLVVGFAVRLRGSVSVGLTGVSLVQLISLSETLNMLIQFWTSIETSIGAVARIKQFAEETPEENRPGENLEPPADWPSEGHVVISNLSASYGDDGEIQALNDMNIDIRPGEKVAICGRTGSGKSSLLLALLRLLEPSTGTITIDSQPLARLPRDTVRTRLITVTQDQFVLPGTVRHNIDPLGGHDDAAIEAVLAAVGLREAIEQRGGLDAPFGDDALSHGQRQLFFVARAVLRKDLGRVVLLDEAMSSVDQETERMVRQVIETQCGQHTVLCIAHRLEAIMEYDRVILLDHGRVMETGKPKELLLSDSKFKALWQANQRHTS
ncbi:ABC multidrug transporter [Purpureocillium lavendulum]|uniref:ABC multidrug transporter n=1 Tax=Purpureocillium lavendulum TaxID=1247861 RepID=A0AB34FZ08_9HYPO|nr:ABC multidrug transporter [Purpureocillium lavendulum]